MEQLKNIRLLAMDVDGVLTDGQIVYGDRGQELKSFDVKDGLGLFQAGQAGLVTAFITGRTSEAVRRRAEELRINYCLQGVGDKKEALLQIIEELRITPASVAYVGDDINDLSAFDIVGFPVAVADAVKELKEIAAYICQRPGGHGAIREVVELILEAQGRWSEAVDKIRNGIKVRQ